MSDFCSATLHASYMVAIKQQLSFLHSLNIVLRRIVSSTPIIEIRSRFIRIHILQQSTVWLICSELWCSCSHSISVSSKRISLFVKLRFQSYASSLQHPNTNQPKQAALDQGQNDRICLTLDLDLQLWSWPSRVSYGHDVHTSKSSGSAVTQFKR